MRSSVFTKSVQRKTGFSLISMQKPTRIHGTIPRPVTLEVWPTDREEFKFSVALRPQRPSGLLATGSLGRPPRLSHSPWSLCLCLSVSVSLSLSLCLSLERERERERDEQTDRETDRQTGGRGGTMDALCQRVGTETRQYKPDSTLQAWGYDILLPTTALIGYAVSLHRLSTFFVGVQMAAGLLPRRQLSLYQAAFFSFMTAHDTCAMTK